MVGFQPLNITSDDLNCLSHSPSPRDKVSLTLEELPYLQRERRGGGGGGGGAEKTRERLGMNLKDQIVSIYK